MALAKTKDMNNLNQFRDGKDFFLLPLGKNTYKAVLDFCNLQNEPKSFPCVLMVRLTDEGTATGVIKEYSFQQWERLQQVKKLYKKGEVTLVTV